MIRMGFKDILLHIDETPPCAKRVELAIHLARQQGAQLTGLFVLTQPPYAPAYEGLKRQAMAAEQKLRQAAAKAAVAVEWILAQGGIAEAGVAAAINHYAHTRDLVILGQAGAQRLPDGAPADLPERIIFGSGRPVLIVPDAGEFTSVGTCSIVAWRGARASARAVNDALPLLMKAKKIYALSIRTAADPRLRQPSCSDLCSHLQRHGLSCSGEEIPAADIPVANILMNFAWDKGCDLLVVGVYAHTAGGKRVFGPVGRQLLRDMTLPVLMSY